MVNEAIVLAGGFGTRLTTVKDVPKPMAPIKDIPFLTYILERLSVQGIQKVHLAVGYKHETIINYFGNTYKNIDLSYVVEDTPLGTGGAVVKALNHVSNDHVFIVNGDTFFEVNLQDMAAFHQQKGSAVTLALKPLTNFDRYGRVIHDDTNRIIQFSEKQFCSKGTINGGIYLMDKQAIGTVNFPEQFSLEQAYFEQYYTTKDFYGFISEGYFIDIGIPSDYEKAQLEMPSMFSINPL